LASWSTWWRPNWIRASGYTLSWLLALFLIGYLVARVHRSHRVPLVLLFTVSSCGVIWSWFVFALRDFFGHGFPHYYFFAILLNLSMPAAILAGGGLFKAEVKKQP
jgi:biotin transporter BioY